MKEKEKEEIYIETKFQSTKLRKKMGEKKKKREKNRKGNWTGENPMYSLKSWIKRNETTESKKKKKKKRILSRLRRVIANDVPLTRKCNWTNVHICRMIVLFLERP